MKFSNLSGARVTSASTSIFVFYDLPGEPWVEVHPTGELNRPYFSALLASNSKSRRRLMKGKLDADMLVQNRNLDRKLFPKHIGAGSWGGWISDETGQEVDYSEAEFKDLCEQLPDDQFDELRAHCGDLTNFREEDEPTEEDIEETSGN